MSTFYVDLGISGGTGVIGDPFGFTDFIAHTNSGLLTANTYLIKGLKSVPLQDIILNLSESNLQTYEAWDLDLYGPWQIKCLSFKACFTDILQDAIIETAGDLIIGHNNPTSAVRNSFLKNTDGVMIVKEAYGSNLVGVFPAVLYVGSSGTQKFFDSTVDHTLQIDVDESNIQLGHSSVVFQDLNFPDIG